MAMKGLEYLGQRWIAMARVSSMCFRSDERVGLYVV
jgi:hypothetical protein